MSLPRSLHLSAAPAGSGSDIAARRLRAALQAATAQADWISADAEADRLFWLRSARASRLLGRAVDRLDRRRHGLHLSITPGLRSAVLRRWPADVIHLHWLGTGFLSLLSLQRLHKPLVWTLHDLWPLLGVESYPPLGPVPPQGRPWELDLDPLARAIKRRCLPAGVQFVAPSRWAAELAAATPVYQALAGARPIAVIPNALDPLFLQWQPPAGPPLQPPPLLLFGGSNAFSDPRKGWPLLQPLLAWLAVAAPQWRFASFGEQPPAGLELPLACEHHGPIRDPQRLAALYSSAAVMVVPSLQETFGQVAAEAQACGVPVLAFANSGVASVVRDGVSGMLASRVSSEALQQQLAPLLHDPGRRQALGAAARRLAREQLAPAVVAAQHLELYQQLLAPSGL